MRELTGGQILCEALIHEGVVFLMHTSSPTNPAEGSSRGVVQYMRQHPILSYFLLAFGLSWAYAILVLLLWHLPLLPWGIPLPFVGPTLSAFLVTAVTSGKKGVGELLRRYVRGRVGLQ